MNLIFFAQSDLVVGGPTLPSVWRTLGATLVVLVLLAGLAWALRRQQAVRRTGRGLGIESGLSLGERRSVAIVTVEGRRLLLGLAPNSVTLLTELQPLPSFEEAVTQATGQGGSAS